MRTATVGILLLVTGGLIVWDVIAYAVGGPSATISAVVLDASLTWPVVGFAAGVLAGHLFWPQRTDKEK